MKTNEKTNKLFLFLDKTTILFEIAIAFLLLIVITIKVMDLIFELAALNIIILNMDFERILSVMFTLVIGVEFIRMLYRHTPLTVINVLLFAIARQIILYKEGVMYLLIGVISIAGLFAAKKYFIDNQCND